MIHSILFVFFLLGLIFCAYLAGKTQENLKALDRYQRKQMYHQLDLNSLAYFTVFVVVASIVLLLTRGNLLLSSRILAAFYPFWFLLMVSSAYQKLKQLQIPAAYTRIWLQSQLLLAATASPFMIYSFFKRSS